MPRHDIEVLEQAACWARQGQRAALVTVLGTHGASPRPPGSMALIRADGVMAGSVSGGCVEDELVQRLAHGGWLDQPGPVQLLAFGDHAQERARLRLPCGHSLRLAVETRLDAGHLAEALEAVRGQRAVVRRVRYDSGAASLEAAAPEAVFQDDAQGFRAVLGPKYRLLIIGANDLGRRLASLMLTLDDAVTVCDPRQEHRHDWPLADAALVSAMPDDAVMAFGCDARTAVIAVTHDPKLDDLALMEALKLPCYHVGALGSRRSNDARRARLKLFDLDQAQVDRLQGPVGLPIGSRTPAEIAVSIAAGLIAQRQGLLALAPAARAGEVPTRAVASA